MAALRKRFRLQPGAELSIEVDPRTVDAGRLAHLRALGFNRLSFGVQDFDPAVQKAVHRVQPLEQVGALMQSPSRRRISSKCPSTSRPSWNGWRSSRGRASSCWSRVPSRSRRRAAGPRRHAALRGDVQRALRPGRRQAHGAADGRPAAGLRRWRRRLDGCLCTGEYARADRRAVVAGPAAQTRRVARCWRCVWPVSAWPQVPAGDWRTASGRACCLRAEAP